MYLQFIVVCLYIMRPRPRGARYSVCVPSLAPPGEARHHLLELPGIFLRQLRHHLADLVLDARVARRRAPPRQHLRRQYCNRNIFSNMTNIFVSILLFVDIYTYF